MTSLRITSIFAIGGLSVAVAVAALFAQAPAAGDEAAVREVVRKYVEAREARDPKAIEPLLTADADQLVSDGTWRRGREALVRGMLESSRRTGGRRTIAVESVRFLANDVAIADGRYTQTGLAGGRDREMWTSIVLKRGADGWRIAAIRNMLPSAPVPPAAAPAPQQEKPAARAIRYEAEDALPKDEAAEKRRDYAVLEAALNDLTTSENPEYKAPEGLQPRSGDIVIHHKTYEYGFDDPGPESENSLHQDPRPIPGEIREDLRRRNDGRARSLADFRPANPHIKVRDLDQIVDRAGGTFFFWEEIRKQFPDAWGYVQAYRPGYSRDGRIAILVFDGGPGLGDHDVNWIYSLARKGTRWEVEWRHLHIRE